MKHYLLSARAALLSAALLLVFAAAAFPTMAQEGVLGTPQDPPVDVCPQEIVGYELIGAIDFGDPKTTLEDWTGKEGVVILSRGDLNLTLRVKFTRTSFASLRKWSRRASPDWNILKKESSRRIFWPRLNKRR